MNAVLAGALVCSTSAKRSAQSQLLSARCIRAHAGLPYLRYASRLRPLDSLPLPSLLQPSLPQPSLPLPALSRFELRHLPRCVCGEDVNNGGLLCACAEGGWPCGDAGLGDVGVAASACSAAPGGPAVRPEGTAPVRPPPDLLWKDLFWKDLFWNDLCCKPPVNIANTPCARAGAGGWAGAWAGA